jgi:hypothetical protein
MCSPCGVSDWCAEHRDLTCSSSSAILASLVEDVRLIRDQSERLLEDRIQQPQRHGAIMPNRWLQLITAGPQQVPREVVPPLVELEVAVPRLSPAVR